MAVRQAPWTLTPPSPVLPDDGWEFSTGQLTCDVVPLQLVEANPRRRTLVLTNTGGSTVFLVSSQAGNIGGGHAIPASGSFGTTNRAAMWLVSSGGGELVTWYEGTG